MNTSIDTPAATSSEFDDHGFARQAALAAGALLLSVREEVGPSDPRRLRDEGDRRSHELLMEMLATHRPGDGVLSEEGSDDRRRLSSRRVWIVDPLDGTREFSEPPRDDWAVHVGLAIDGVPAAGAVALPAQDRVYCTSDPARSLAPMPDRLRIVASRSRAPEVIGHLTRMLDADTVLMGSAGAKAMAILAGDVDVYVHAGGQYEWDSEAPVAVALAAGLHCSRIDGSPLRYNNPNPYLPDLVISRREIAGRVLGALRVLAADGAIAAPPEGSAEKGRVS